MLNTSMEAENQLLLKRFPNSSISSLIRNWMTPGMASSHQELVTIPMVRKMPDGDWSLYSTSSQINFCKESLKVGCVPWGRQTFNLSLSWKKIDVYKINYDDDEDATSFGTSTLIDNLLLYSLLFHIPKLLGVGKE